MPIESDHLLNFLAKECRSAKLDGDEDNALEFWNLLDKPLRDAIRHLFADSREQDDLIQEAARAIFKRIDSFAPERGSFRTWAKMQAYSAKVEYLRNTGPYSRMTAGHKKLIVQAIENKEEFPNGPRPGQTWLELARENVSKISRLTNLSKDQVLEALTDWGVEEADESDYLQIVDPQDTFHSQLLREDLDLAMSRLDQRSRTFLLQRHASGFSYAEIAEKFNLTKSVSERPMTEANARQIVKLAIKKLRDGLDGMDGMDGMDQDEQ